MNVPYLTSNASAGNTRSSRFETIAFFAFLLCLLGTAVGVWVGGKNYKSAR